MLSTLLLMLLMLLMMLLLPRSSLQNVCGPHREDEDMTLLR